MPNISKTGINLDERRAARRHMVENVFAKSGPRKTPLTRQQGQVKQIDQELRTSSYTALAQQTGVSRGAVKREVQKERHKALSEIAKAGAATRRKNGGGSGRAGARGSQETMIFHAETHGGDVVKIAAKSGNAALKVARGMPGFKRMQGRAA